MFDWMKESPVFKKYFEPAPAEPTQEQCVNRAANEYYSWHLDHQDELASGPQAFEYNEGGCHINYMDGTAPGTHDDGFANEAERFVSSFGFDPYDTNWTDNQVTPH